MSSTTYIGQIKLFAFDFVPKGWLPCDGQLLKVSEFTALFAYLGNAYTERTTPPTHFRIPDMRGFVPIHRGRGTGEGMSNTYTLGRPAGSASFIMRMEHMPQHTHEIATPREFYPDCSSGDPNTPSPVNAYPAATKGISSYSATGEKPSCETPFSPQNVKVSTTGAGLAFSIAQPCIGLRYCICIDGIFPAPN